MQIKPNNPNFNSGPNIGGWSVCWDVRHHLIKENMKAKSKPKSKLHLLSIVWGLIFTSFMILAVGSKMIIGIIEDGRLFLNELPESFSNPLDPTLYFFTYIIGYVVI